ncbi:3-hydroxyacyl-CoA dehydrogenase NAD-binding domain-containing protein [Bradyrhizobium sp. LM2.3]
MPEFQKINVIGLGYIGLPTAALIASRGLQVVGIDTNERIVDTVASGRIHIAEPDLDGLVSKGRFEWCAHDGQTSAAGGRVHHRSAHTDRSRKPSRLVKRECGSRLYRRSSRARQPCHP